MTLKLALLIGNSQYQDPILAKLKAPDSDISELAKILQDPTIGGFDQVTTILSEVSNEVRAAIGDFFAERKRDDLLLLYFSGHGVLDENGYFYLAVKDTQHNRLRATGISASFIKEEMENCRSSRQVLVLDSCHSGAFARGKGAVGLNAITRATFEGAGGYGHVVLTATDATQYAWEGDQIIGNVKTSLFTHFLIEGLRTGQADSDRDGRITLDEIYDYVYEQVRAHTPHQTPRKWEQAREGEELVIARSSYRPTGLPSELRQALESTLPNIREGAIHELGQLLRGSDKSLVRLARGILKAMVKDDDSQRVRSAALAILRSYEETKTVQPTPRQDRAAPILSIPPHEKTSPSKPLPRPARVVPAPSASNSPKRIWLLWGGMGTVILIFMAAYVLSNFAAHPPLLDTPTPTLTAPTVETLISTQAVAWLPTNTPPSFATDTLASTTLGALPTLTLIQPTSMLVPPTGILVPTITPVPSNTPTNTPTPIPVPPMLTPIGGGAGKIAFTSDQNGNYEIYVMNADGSALTNLTNNSALDSSLSWSPDGRRIAFSSNRDGNPDFYVMNANGSNPIRLTNTSQGEGSPSWSPDGGKITFYAVTGLDISSEEISVINADGNGQNRLTQNSSYDFDPTWSPDGTKIVFCAGRDGNPEIYMMNADGSGQVNLTNYGAGDYYPKWSPDGRKITFTSNRDGNLEIYVMNADGSGLMRLTQNSAVEHYASWSPDGKKIVFASSRDDPNPSTCAENCKYEIYVMNMDGSGQIKLTNSASNILFPLWSP
jgi:Tol biopolymer transport system component